MSLAFRDTVFEVSGKEQKKAAKNHIEIHVKLT